MKVMKRMQSVGTCEAKTKLSELLDKVNEGESFTITRHGVPAAYLIRPVQQSKANVREAIAAIRERRRNFAVAFENEPDIKSLIEEGRK
jgi:prevent-host-death family protein